MNRKRSVTVAWGLAGLLLSPALLLFWLGAKLGNYACEVWYVHILGGGWRFMGLQVGDIHRGWKVTAIDEQYGPDGNHAYVEWEQPT